MFSILASRRRLLQWLAGVLPAAAVANRATRAVAGEAGAPATTEPASYRPATPWLPLDPSQTLTRIAFGSCLHQGYPQPIWRGVLSTAPQVFVMMGDNVYGDVTGPELVELKAAYAAQLAHPDFQAARAALPFLATWDDHDFGANDAGAAFPYIPASAEVFHAYWGLEPARGLDGGVYQSRVVGPEGRRVQIILLDTRTFRSPLARRSGSGAPGEPAVGRYARDFDATKTMLGEAQWAWLEAELTVPAEIRLLVSSIQLLAENHGWERWGNLPAERARLFAVLKRSGAGGVIVLSGDRHRAAVYRVPGVLRYPLVEATSSSLNRPFPAAEPPDPGRLWSNMFGGANFGLLSIDWDQRAVVLSIKDTTGQTVIEMGADGVPHGAMILSFADLGL